MIYVCLCVVHIVVGISPPPNKDEEKMGIFQFGDTQFSENQFAGMVASKPLRVKTS